MKTLLTICALAAGVGLAANSKSVEAGHCHRGGYGYGGGYSTYYAPSYRYGHNHGYNRGYSNFGYRNYGYGNRGFNRGYYGNRGYGYGNRGGFSVRSRNFGFYIR